MKEENTSNAVTTQPTTRFNKFELLFQLLLLELMSPPPPPPLATLFPS